MAYYFVDVSMSSNEIGCLIGASNAVIESVNEDLFGSKIYIHLVDYKDSARWSSTRFTSPSRKEGTWKIIKKLNNVPKPHRFKIGDLVKLNKDFKIPLGVGHIADSIYNINELVISHFHYYDWEGVTYAVVGFENGYGGWCPEDILIHADIDTKSDDYNWKPGDWVYVKNHPGSGIPYPLERSELVQIVDPNVYKMQGGLNKHTHLVRFEDKILGVSCIEGQFSLNNHYKDKGNWCVGQYVYATNELGVGNGLGLNFYTKIKIVPDINTIYASGMLEVNDWTHIVELADYPGVYYRVNYKSADFRLQPPNLPENPCSEEHYFESGTLSGTSGTIVMNDFPYVTTSTTIYSYPQTPEECLEKTNGIQILKLQKPKTLKPQKDGNTIKLRKYRIS